MRLARYHDAPVNRDRRPARGIPFRKRVPPGTRVRAAAGAAGGRVKLESWGGYGDEPVDAARPGGSPPAAPK